MRATRAGVGILVAIGFLYLGAIFGLNGEQWGWWRWAATAGAGVVLVVALLPSRARWAVLPGGSRSAAAAGGALGAALVAVSLTVMAKRYSDPYDGPLFWPHALAAFAFLGFLIAVVSVALGTGRPGRRA
jgi:drug/metabolite transporter (DMT)-like permease